MPSERQLIARAAAHALHAQGGTNTGPARAAFLLRFEEEVDPDRLLDPDERSRRAEHARRSYFALLALKSARARRARRGGADEPSAA